MQAVATKHILAGALGLFLGSEVGNIGAYYRAWLKRQTKLAQIRVALWHNVDGSSFREILVSESKVVEYLRA
jgi:hypothetical protein